MTEEKASFNWCYGLFIVYIIEEAMQRWNYKLFVWDSLPFNDANHSLHVRAILQKLLHFPCFIENH